MKQGWDQGVKVPPVPTLYEMVIKRSTWQPNQHMSLYLSWHRRLQQLFPVPPHFSLGVQAVSLGKTEGQELGLAVQRAAVKKMLYLKV